MAKENSIRSRYSLEVNAVLNRLDDLKKGRIYEITHTRGDGSHHTIAENIKKDFLLLLDMIDNDAPSATDLIFNKEDK
ncbi:hypothetical protein PGC35_14260 [Psychrobacillus sp. PGGUH221]|uniref:hypothetical protein n=1 Tax=Psychrobacillus sp. PGGUH221 TaxID=3020058 RepID=UPI0035C74921